MCNLSGSRDIKSGDVPSLAEQVIKNLAYLNRCTHASSVGHVKHSLREAFPFIQFAISVFSSRLPHNHSTTACIIPLHAKIHDGGNNMHTQLSRWRNPLVRLGDEVLCHRSLQQGCGPDPDRQAAMCRRSRLGMTAVSKSSTAIALRTRKPCPCCTR